MKKRKKKVRKSASLKRAAVKRGKRPAARGRAHAKKREVRVKTPEDRLYWRIFGVVICALAILTSISLFTFDWQSVAALCEDPRPTTNLTGEVGNLLAYAGYAIFGLAIWFLPVVMIIGAMKLFDPIPDGVEEIPNRSVALRISGFTMLVVVISGFFQLAGRCAWVRYIIEELHIGADAGGWIGKMFMTDCLERAFATFGAFFVSVCLLFIALCMAIGLKTVRRLFDWHMPNLDWIGDLADGVKEEARRIGGKPDSKAAMPARGRQAAKRTRRPAPEINYPVNAELPPVELLDSVKEKGASGNDVAAMGDELMKKLKEFGVFATLSYTVEGPTVTQFAIKPGHGVRVDRIKGLSRDLQLALKVKSLRVFAPIPGEEAVGIQVSNPNPQTVMFRSVIESDTWQRVAVWPVDSKPEYPVPLLLGQDVAGDAVVADLTKMPHLLVAGASGKGKSVCLNSMINGLLMTRTPEQLRFILVDPKRMEFSSYASMPHLLVPVVVDVRKVLGALNWAAREMESRLKRFAEQGARDIIEFNDSAEAKVPYIVIVIDEVADIMTLCGREVEPVLGRLMALARATGIHLILATQRPDAKTISGTIKANIPGRVALATTNATDSRTILDESGAELLIGRGDMLYKSDDGLVRTQGAWVSKAEMSRIMDFIVKQWPAEIDESIMEEMDREADEGGRRSSDDGEDGISEDEFIAAREIVVDARRASISLLQQRMKVGYNHASRIVDLLERRGVIGPRRGAGPREVLVES